MKTARIFIVCLCIAAGFASCKGKNSSSNADSSQVSITKDSSGTMSDSTMGKVPDSAKKGSAQPAAAGAKAHVDSVTKSK